MLRDEVEDGGRLDVGYHMMYIKTLLRLKSDVILSTRRGS